MINIVKKDCVGCGGCVNICPIDYCINMKPNEEGFLYPVIDEKKCIKCEKCINVCPVLKEVNIPNKPIAYACFNKNDNIRRQSSSGGIFTLIAEKVINNHGFVFGAKFNEKFEVEHSYINNVEDIILFRGSKYVQSKIGNSFKCVKKFLEEGKYVLFSGTPCQVGGLKSFLKKDYENLICLDIICHGVPSPLVWDKYKEYIAGDKKITNVTFRDKKHGWKNYSFKMDFDDGTSYLEKGAENKYIRGFIADIYLRPSCYQCKFKSLYRQSDLTLADFWGIENIDKEMDDDKGTSFIIVNSDKGNKIIEDIKNQIKIKKVDLNESVKYNVSAIKSSEYNPRRKYFFRNINKWEFDELVDKSLQDPFIVRIKTKIYMIMKKFKIK